MPQHTVDRTISLEWAAGVLQARGGARQFELRTGFPFPERVGYQSTTVWQGEGSTWNKTADCGLYKRRVGIERRESLQRLQEVLLLQGSEQAGFCAEEEKRIEASKQAVQRARNERNDRYKRLQRAFERMNRWTRLRWPVKLHWHPGHETFIFARARLTWL